MRNLEEWLIYWVKVLCDWLNNNTPGQHPLALAGNALAGIKPGPLLPVDRRFGLEIIMMANAMNAGQVGPHAKGKDKTCGFWAYCGMMGYLCTNCGGGNAFDGKKVCCPSGTVKGNAWYSCCKDPNGKGRYIGWVDCCQKKKTAKPCGGPPCVNNPNVADWCAGVGYLC